MVTGRRGSALQVLPALLDGLKQASCRPPALDFGASSTGMVPAFGAPGRLISDHPEARELFRVPRHGGYLTLVMIPLMESALERARALPRRIRWRRGSRSTSSTTSPRRCTATSRAAPRSTTSRRSESTPAHFGLGRFRRRSRSLIGNQYFWIWHHHPVALLGLLELEAYHPDKESVEQLMERTGLPADGFRQLLLHAELDVDHAEELHQVLDSLPLTPEHEQAIALSALQAMALLTDAWLDVLADAPVAAGR